MFCGSFSFLLLRRARAAGNASSEVTTCRRGFCAVSMPVGQDRVDPGAVRAGDGHTQENTSLSYLVAATVTFPVRQFLCTGRLNFLVCSDGVVSF